MAHVEAFILWSVGGLHLEMIGDAASHPMLSLLTTTLDEPSGELIVDVAKRKVRVLAVVFLKGFGSVRSTRQARPVVFIELVPYDSLEKFVCLDKVSIIAALYGIEAL